MGRKKKIETVFVGVDKYEIRRGDEGSLHGVSNGVCMNRHGTEYPVTPQNEKFAEDCKKISDELYGLKIGASILGWIETATYRASDDDDAQKEVISNVKSMLAQVKKIQQMTYRAVPDLRIFR